MPTTYTDLNSEGFRFVCPDGRTGEWPEPWYLDNKAEFDNAAVHGPINPPQEAWETVCLPTSDWWATKTTNLRMPVSVAEMADRASLTDPLANFNSRAGHIDWQAFGAAITAVITFGLGLLCFLAWAIVRKKIPAIYSPTSWFRPPGSRPKKSRFRYSLFPFRRLPPLDAPASEPAVWANLSAGTLAVSFSLAIFALAVYLPICTVGVPHLDETAPRNNRGGRLGSLTDLSFTRLTDGMNPAPNSPQGQNRTFTRWHAQSRMIGILVVMFCNTLIALAICWYVYHRLFVYSMNFDAAAGCQDMVFIPESKAPAWKGLPEKVIQRDLRLGAVDEGTVAGVFAVPNIHSLRALIRERAHVLDVLEAAEYKLIMSFPTDVLCRLTGRPKGESSSPPRMRRSSSDDSAPVGKHGSVYLEGDALPPGEHMRVGERVERGEDGSFHRVPGDSGHGITPYDVNGGDHHSSGDGNGATKDGHTDDPTRNSSQWKGSPFAHPSQMIIDHPYDTLPTPHQLPADLLHLKNDIAWARGRLRRLNGDVELAQRQAIDNIGTGTDIVGWIIVGRGVAGLPFAEVIPGRSKDEIIWENLGKPHNKCFFLKRMTVTFIVAILCVPFLGLGLASAPGVSWYLGFLAPLARHNGAASGVAEGWCAALGIICLLIIAVFVLLHFVRTTSPISWVIHRNMHTEASFRLLRTINMFWLIVIAALEFAIAALASGVGEVRSIGDGIVYINWLTFIMMCNLSIIVPGLVYLQPLRLARWLYRRRKPQWQTPRQRFRLNYPPDFNPVWAVAPGLAVVAQGAALGPMFPLLNCPGLVITYLVFTAHCWLTKHVYHTSRGGPVDAQSAIFLWSKLGGAICNQPLIMGIVLCLNGNFEIGGGSLGLWLLLQIVMNVTQGFSHRRPKRVCFPEVTAAELERIPDPDEKKVRDLHPLVEELYTTRYGLSCLPPDNPLPFSTDKIDDLLHTERASHASPQAAAQADVFGYGADPSYGHTDRARGYIYPPELLAPAPDVWLPRDGFGVAQREAKSLAAEGLSSVIDPVVRRNKACRDKIRKASPDVDDE